MSRSKVTSLNQIWPERELCAHLGLDVPKEGGRSRTLSSWVAQGLPYIERSDRRWFIEPEVISFLTGEGSETS